MISSKRRKAVALETEENPQESSSYYTMTVDNALDEFVPQLHGRA
jgi:hypothetical protein